MRDVEGRKSREREAKREWWRERAARETERVKCELSQRMERIAHELSQKRL